MFKESQNSPNSQNRMEAYFNGTDYLSQQQEISLFIKNFPIIQISQIDSINSLIALIIQQNSLLSNKCQQQVSLLKQAYHKHESLSKSIRQIKIQNSNLKTSESTNQSLKQTMQNVHQQQLVKLMQQKQVGKKALSELSSLVQLMMEGNFAKIEDLLKQNLYLWHIEGNHIVHVKVFEKHIKDEKKRNKRCSKIRIVIEQFCERLIKIIKVVPIQSLTHEISYEQKQLIELIQDIMIQGFKKNKHKGQNLKKSNSCYFESLLERVTEHYSSSKMEKQSIEEQLSEMKNNLKQSKQYYENYIIKIKIQLENQQRSNTKDLENSKWTNQTIEMENHKLTEKINELSKRFTEQERNYNQSLQQLQKCTQQLKVMTKRQNQRQEELYIKKKQIMEVEEQFNNKIKEMMKRHQSIVEQKNQLINEVKSKYEKHNHEYQLEIMEFKHKMQVIENSKEQIEGEVKRTKSQLEDCKARELINEDQMNTLRRQLQEKLQQGDKLNKQGVRMGRQISELQDQLKEYLHEKQLHVEYIRQLQKKLQVCHDKIKRNEEHQCGEATAKKENNKLKNHLNNQQIYTKELQTTNKHQKQENNRLRIVIKEMKKQLEDVYVRVNQLKQIEIEREKLITDAQNSYRLRDKLLKEIQNSQQQVFRVQTENKSLMLELKHFKNALKRIQALN